MFERNQIDKRVAKGTVSARITLDDGRVLAGKFVIPVNKSIFDVLNGTGGFLEFEPFEGEREFVAKHTLRSVKLTEAPRGENLEGRLRNLDGFDPHTILGVARGTDWEDIRHAYLTLAKIYHPDRYSTAVLPGEVSTYLETMAQRVNAAYSALEIQYNTGRQDVSMTRAEPVYTSQPRR